MAILFNENTKVFTLKNNNISYVFYVNNVGALVKLYFGKNINVEFNREEINYLNDCSGDVYSYFDIQTNKEFDCTKPYFSATGSMIEMPGHNSYDKRTSAVVLTHDDNSNVTDFRYHSHRILKGKTTFKNMPYIKNCDNEETLIVTLKDRRDEIYLDMYYTLLSDLDVLVRHNEIRNLSEKPCIINKLCSFSLDLPSLEYNLLSVHGTYATDREIETQNLKHNKIVIDENAGAKGFYHNPVFMLLDKKASNIFGEVIGGALVYSGNFKIEFNGTNMDSLRVVAGINDDQFESKVNPNETFISPEGFLIYSNEGTNKVTHTFHDLIRNHLLKYVPGFENTILLNSWEACYMEFDTQKIKDFITQAKKMDVNLVVLDDGWFGKRNKDDSSLGDWYVNNDKINLKEVIDFAHSKNIKFGLWIEPEQISFDSELYRAHPEFALYDSKLNPTTLRHQFVLDMTNEKARDNVFSQIEKIFSEYDIDYCKWDFNRMLTEAYSMSLENSKQKEIFHLFTLGTYDLLNRFVNRFPNVLLETCSGGGGRFDLGMLFYSHQIWASDETDAISRSEIQYSTNLFYPLECIGSHVSARKHLTIKEKAAVAMFGTFGYELDPLKLTDEQIEEVKISNKRFLDNKEIIDKGDYYPLLNPFEGNFVAWECVKKDKSDAIIFFMNYRHINWRSRYVKLFGLDPKGKYKNSFNNEVYSGDYYMNIGLNLSFGMTNLTPMLIEIRKVNE